MKIRYKIFPIILSLLVLSNILSIQVYAAIEVGKPRSVQHKDLRYHLSGALWSKLADMKPTIYKLDKGDLNAAPSKPSTPISPSVANYTFTYNTRVSEDIYYYENEPSIAASRADPSNLIVATHQYTDAGIYIAAYASNDSGDSWVGPKLLPLVKPSDMASDPAISATDAGLFYLSYMSIGTRIVALQFYNVSITTNDIVVASSSDGIRWRYSIAVNANQTASLLPPTIYPSMILFDKEYISAMTVNQSDVVVVSFTEFDIGYDYNLSRGVELITVKAVISFDGGSTWAPPIPVSPTYDAMEFERVVQGSSPLVAPDGSIYVAYYDSGEDGWLNGSAYIRVAKLVNGSFAEVGQVKLPNEISYYSGAIGFRWWSSMFPVLKSDPEGGYLYLVFAADPDGVGGDPSDVFFARIRRTGPSDYVVDMSPRRLNDDDTLNGQFFPWIDVDPEGGIHIIWGDRRMDPSDFGYDVYYAYSDDGGGTFSPNVRVTDVTINPMYGMVYFIGDYFNLVATGENVHIVWTDCRRGLRYIGGFYWMGVDESIYTAKLGPRPSPNIVITLDSEQSGESHILKLRGSSLPREAPLAVYIDGVSASAIGLPIFTDSEGNLETTIVLPVSSAGTHTVSVGDMLTQIPYGSMNFTLEDISAANIINNMNTGLNSLHADITGLLNSQYSALSSKLDEISNEAGDIMSSISDLGTHLESVEADILNRIDGAVTDLIGSLGRVFTVDIVTLIIVVVGIAISIAFKKGEPRPPKQR